MGFTFFLGSTKAHWLTQEAPIFISVRRLSEYRLLPRASCTWALDSGGFTELSRFGRWTISPRSYVAEVRRYQDIGGLVWAASQDWMCEPMILARTGFSLRGHQERTVASYLELVSLASDLPWVPVLQGYSLSDYLRCAEDYERAGVRLDRLPLVGVGTLCRRQGTEEAVEILRTLAGLGLRLHAFGLKHKGLKRCLPYLASSDSMAWSYHARRRAPLPGHTHIHCGNCQTYALQWRERFIERLTT